MHKSITSFTYNYSSSPPKSMQLWGVGERRELPQLVRTESDCQTLYGAF